ncbi:MAG: hypothetical protein JXR05_09500 [Flavobacteriaceae bacterium]
MKVNYIILIIGLLIGNTNLGNQEFEFVSDSIDIFTKLDKSTIEFYSTLENSTDPDKLYAEIIDYNKDLTLFSLNKLSKYTKSENLIIEAVANDLNTVITDLVKLLI